MQRGTFIQFNYRNVSFLRNNQLAPIHQVRDDSAIETRSCRPDSDRGEEVMSNARNAKTTHPRKQARRDRAADRFTINKSRLKDKAYMDSKTTEAIALGLSAWLMTELA